jgi:hypothetical protein
MRSMRKPIARLMLTDPNLLMASLVCMGRGNSIEKSGVSNCVLVLMGIFCNWCGILAPCLWRLTCTPCLDLWLNIYAFLVSSTVGQPCRSVT